MRLLIVKLGSIGDIIHTLPSLAAIRAAPPDTRFFRRGSVPVNLRHRLVAGGAELLDENALLTLTTLENEPSAVRRVRMRGFFLD